MLTEKFTFFAGPVIPDKFLQFVETADEISIDLEADGLHHYFARVCLIQLNVADKIYIVDPLENINTAMLFEAIGKKTLIFHGGSYDLHLMREDYSFIPDNIFDTMIAGQILGIEKLGLVNLVEKYFRVSLSKGPQKMDWSQRPLSDKMFDYSANDVKYLPKLKQILTKELEEKGRMNWMKENCEKLLLSESFEHAKHHLDEESWRIKGSSVLDRRTLAFLRELWNWREKEAQGANVPVYKIMKNENLIELAVWCASENRPVFSWHLFDKYIKKKIRGEECERARIRAKKLNPSKWPEKKHPTGSKGLSEVNPVFFDKIKLARDRISSELKMDPAIILTQKVISKIATLKEYDPDILVNKFGLCLWQRDLIANDLIKIFAEEE